MTPVAAPAPRLAVFKPCVTSVDLGGPVMAALEWPRHAWVADQDAITCDLDGRAMIHRRSRCSRCGTEWIVSGEPNPRRFE